MGKAIVERDLEREFGIASIFIPFFTFDCVHSKAILQLLGEDENSGQRGKEGE